MGIGPAPLCVNLFLRFFASTYIKQLISKRSFRVYKYHGVSGFIDDLYAKNDGNEFLTSFKNIVLRSQSSKSKTKETKPHFWILTSKQRIVFSNRNSLTKEINFNTFSANVPCTKQFIIYNFLWVYFSELLRTVRCTLRINTYT